MRKILLAASLAIIVISSVFGSLEENRLLLEPILYPRYNPADGGSDGRGFRQQLPVSAQVLVCLSKKCSGLSAPQLLKCLLMPCHLPQHRLNTGLEHTIYPPNLHSPTRRNLVNGKSYIQACVVQKCSDAVDFEGCVYNRCLGRSKDSPRDVPPCERECMETLGQDMLTCQRECHRARQDAAETELEPRRRRTWHDPLVCAEKKCKNKSGVSLIVCRSQHCG